MLCRLAFGYRITKPRVNNHNTQSLREFRREVHEARRRAHMDAVEYQNKIEDEFLERHQKEVANQHFKNECRFRSMIARHSFRMFEQIEKRKQTHQDYLDRLQKYIHDQDVKKLNRIRIKKILEYESANYWLQGDNINEKIISQNVLPQYIGSTQYYHKLHSQALAYDNLDFDLLHKMSSTEETVREKNRMLIPIFKQFLASLKQVKFSELQRKERELELEAINLKSHHQGTEGDLNKQIEAAREKFEKWVVEYKSQFNDPAVRRSFLKEKTKDMIAMMKKWKQYTDILSLTSTQIMKMINEKDLEATVNAKKKMLEKEFAYKKQAAFVDPVQEDTQDDEVTLEEYLVTNDTKKTVLESNVEESSLELDSLLKQQESLFQELSQKVEQQEQKQKGKILTQPNLTHNLESQVDQEIFNIDEGYLIYNETTTSIEAMKQIYKDDGQMMKLLNLAGELTIDYPKLFKKIWESQVL